MFYFTFNLHTTNRKFHKTSVCVQACHLMTPVGFVRNMETVVKGRMPTWKKTAIRRAMESSGSLQGESGSSGLSLSPMCYVDSFTGYVTHLEWLLAPCRVPLSCQGWLFLPHLYSENLLYPPWEIVQSLKASTEWNPSQYRQHLINMWHRASTDFIFTCWTRQQFSSQSDRCVGLTT